MTYSDIIRPKKIVFAFVYDIILVIFCSFLIAFSSRIVIPLPFTPVPITMQTFSVLLTGSILGSRKGLISVIVFILSGIAGLPVFASGNSGILYLSGPTGGYIFGFILAAYFTGFFSEKKWDRKMNTTLLSMLIGNILIYIPGLIWLAKFTGFKYVLKMGFYPFIIGDIIKILFAIILLPSGWKILKQRRIYE